MDGLCSINQQMPRRLQGSSRLVILGQSKRNRSGCLDVLHDQNCLHSCRSCSEPSENSGQAHALYPIESTSGSSNGWQHHDIIKEFVDGHAGYCCSASCDPMIRAACSLNDNGSWAFVNVIYSKGKQYPVLHHLHLEDHMIHISDVHVISYDLPTYGSGHFSMSSWGLYRDLKAETKKPKWISALHKRSSLPDLESVILAVNCSKAVENVVGLPFCVNRSRGHLFKAILLRLCKVSQYIMAVVITSISSLLYIFIQLFCKCMSYQFLKMILRISFRHSWKCINIRSCQILFWPIVLEGSHIGCINVEYAHKVSLRKHFIWSNVAVDIAFGFVSGVTLLLNVDAAYVFIVVVVQYITDNILRSGCVWLMGVPAGFKLNTELAELLGIMSLNAVQMYSTFWFFVGRIFLRYIIVFLALSGISLGLTIPASLCIDMLRFATLHVRCLHRMVSFLYNAQIRTLASLWRLFRGRKRNPLRNRIDSYNCTVEQHVVGSLLLTPVLLLLPTTSVFYVFFTMLTTTILLLCGLIEIMISLIHATPYAELVLWILNKRRFPSGLWFHIGCFPSILDADGYYSISYEKFESLSLSERKRRELSNERSRHQLFILQSSFASIRQILKPHYRQIFDGVVPHVGKSLAYGVLSGQRIPSSLNTKMPTPLPWMYIGVREYWTICLNSLLNRGVSY